MAEETSPELPELHLDHNLTGRAAETLRTLHMMFGDSVGGDLNATALRAFEIAGTIMAATEGGNREYYVTVPAPKETTEKTGDELGLIK